MDKQLIARAFNEWMRRFLESPEEFAREWQEVTTFTRETAEGKVPTYGDDCAAYLDRLCAEIGA